MKNHPMETGLFHAGRNTDGRTKGVDALKDRYDEAKGRSS